MTQESPMPTPTPAVEDLDRLESAARAATPGPWNDSGTSVDDFDADCMMRMEWMPNGKADDDDELNDNYKADAAFIAAFNPATALSLISALRASEAERERLRRIADGRMAVASAAVKHAKAYRARATTAEARCRALNEALTPSADTKAAYIGEVKFTVSTGFDEDGSEIWQDITVPWTTTKDIMAMIVGYAAMSETGRTRPSGGDADGEQSQ
jgi:hypothetical protein